MGGARELWGGTFGDSRGAVVMVLFRTNVHPLQPPLQRYHCSHHYSGTTVATTIAGPLQPPLQLTAVHGPRTAVLFRTNVHQLQRLLQEPLQRVVIYYTDGLQQPPEWYNNVFPRRLAHLFIRSKRTLFLCSEHDQERHASQPFEVCLASTAIWQTLQSGQGDNSVDGSMVQTTQLKYVWKLQ